MDAITSGKKWDTERPAMTMNTQMFSRAAKSAGRHKGSIASGSVAALLVTSAFNLAEKWIDSRSESAEVQAINKRIDDLKVDEWNTSRALWQALERKQDIPIRYYSTNSSTP